MKIAENPPDCIACYRYKNENSYLLNLRDFHILKVDTANRLVRWFLAFLVLLFIFD